MKRIIIITTLGTGAVVLAGSFALSVTAAERAYWQDRGTSVERIDEDHGGVPRCTDAIADAGGICWGEPIPSTEAQADLPAVTVSADVIELRPCPTEDADDCYWDAARMGNRIGRSFITVGGITYYAEVTQ